MPFLDIDHVRRIGYAGYDGVIELARNWPRRPQPGLARKSARRAGASKRAA